MSLITSFHSPLIQKFFCHEDGHLASYLPRLSLSPSPVFEETAWGQLIVNRLHSQHEKKTITFYSFFNYTHFLECRIRRGPLPVVSAHLHSLVMSSTTAVCTSDCYYSSTLFLEYFEEEATYHLPVGVSSFQLAY